MQDNYGEYIEIDSIKKDKEWMRLVKWIRIVLAEIYCV